MKTAKAVKMHDGIMCQILSIDTYTYLGVVLN